MSKGRKAKNLTVEVTSPVLRYFQEFLSYMPNPDLILNQRGETLEVYRLMKLDARVSSLLKLRKDYALGFPYVLRPTVETSQAEAIARDVGQVLSGLNLYQELRELLSALEFGYAVAEVVWQLRDGLWVPEKVLSRKPERFSFRADGTLVLLDSPEGPKVLDMPYKFIVHRHEPEAENPYGSSVLRQCYWPWAFKKAGFRFWLTAAEKFGVPTVLALFRVENPDEAAERAEFIAEALSRIEMDAAVALSDVEDVRTLEARGQLRDFRELIDCCNAEISYALTGQSLATAEAEHGTRAQAEVHERTLRKLAGGDARALAWTLQKTLIQWIVELNWGPEAPVPVFEFDTSERTEWQMVKDSIDRGVPVSKKALYRDYGIPEPEGPEDAFVSPEFQLQGIELADVKKKTFLLPRLRRT